MNDINPRYCDKRVAQRYIALGQLEEKAWEKHLKALPDVAEKGDRVQVEAEEYVMDDDLNEGAE